MNSVKAVLFDLDGTLVDCTEWHFEALNKALKEVEMFEIGREDHLTIYNGLPTEKKLRLLVENNKISNKNLETIRVLKRKYTSEILQNSSWDRSNLYPLLTYIRQEGYKLGVVTNSIRAFTEELLQKLQILNLFDTIVTNQDVKYPKPSPDPYCIAVKNFSLLPEECLALEDNEKGVTSALEAGCKCIVTDYCKLSEFVRVNRKLLK